MRSILLLIAATLWLPAVLQAQSWQPAAAGSFEAIAVLSDGSLVVIQYPCDILRSTDRGLTWSAVYRGGAWQSRLIGIAVRNEIAIAYSDSGASLVSRDSGRTWVRTESEEWRKESENAVRALPFALYPLPSARLVLDDSSNILLSRDSGMSWERILRPSSGCIIHSIALVDSVCYAVGEPGLIYVSDNSFEKWTELHHAPFGERNVGLEAASWSMLPTYAQSADTRIEFSSPNHGAIAVGNKIYITEDSGTSWKQSVIPDTNWVSSIYISDTSTLAGMSDGKIFFASNSGSDFQECDSILYYQNPAWAETAPRQTKPILAIGWKDKLEDNMFVLNDSLLYDLKADLHSSYSYQLPLHPGERAESACFADRYTGFVLTDSTTRLDTITSDDRDTTIIHDTSYIYRSLDGGSTWNLVLNNIPGLRKLFFVNTHRGFACGANGLIMRTDDTGSTWSKAFASTKQNLWDVRMVNDSTGYAAGDSGVVLATRNAGRFWPANPPEPLFSHPSTMYGSIAFSDFHTVYVIASDRCYKHTIPNPISAPHFTSHHQQKTTLSVTVSPNPSQGQIEVVISSSATSPTEGAPSLAIDDVSGRPVAENISCWESGQGQWSAKPNLTNASAGVYVAVATMGSQTARFNFVIEK